MNIQNKISEMLYKYTEYINNNINNSQDIVSKYRENADIPEANKNYMKAVEDRQKSFDVKLSINQFLNQNKDMIDSITQEILNGSKKVIETNIVKALDEKAKEIEKLFKETRVMLKIT